MMGRPNTADFVFHHQESPPESDARETKPYQNYHISVSIRKKIAFMGNLIESQDSCFFFLNLDAVL